MPKPKSVPRLSNFNDNVMSISPDQAIQDFQQYLKDNPRFDKVFLLALDSKGQNFDTIWFKGRMLSSEALAVMDLTHVEMVEVLRGEDV